MSESVFFFFKGEPHYQKIKGLVFLYIKNLFFNLFLTKNTYKTP